MAAEPGIKFDRRKFRELVLYIAQRCSDDRTFGATKLNKILFFADFGAYRSLGRPITGAPYQRLPHGPAPRPLVPIKKELIDKGRAIEIKTSYFGQSQTRLASRVNPDLSLFSAEEISLVDGVIEELRDANATQVSELSHGLPGWQLAREGEDIPYFTDLLPSVPIPPSRGDFALAKKLAARLEAEA